MRNLKSSKLLLIASFITLSCSPVFAASTHHALITKCKGSSAIHITKLLTDNKTIQGTITAGFGTSNGSHCTILYEEGNSDYFYNQEEYSLDGELLRDIWGTHITCVTETYKTANESIKIAYNLTYDKENHRYNFATPAFEDTITLH